MSHGFGNAMALCRRTFEAAPADPLDGLDPADPLDGLDPGELRLLYYNARAGMVRTLPPATCALIRRGRCRQVVAEKMRAMRRQGKGSVGVAAGCGGGSGRYKVGGRGS